MITSRTIFRLKLSLIFWVLIAAVFSAEAKKNPRTPIPTPRLDYNYGTNTNDDSDLVRAVRDRRMVRFVQAKDVVVSQVLSDDTKGLPHQRWKVRLSDGNEVLVVYNSNMGPRVPVAVGQKMSLGGEFRSTAQGAIVHWVHFDPSEKRPDGYVILNGLCYGKRP